MSFRLPNLTLSALFATAAQQKAVSDRLHAAALRDVALSNTHETLSTHQKREPIRHQPADFVPIDWDYVGCIIDDGNMEDATNKGFYWTAEQTGSFDVPPVMSAELCTASCSFNRRSTYASMIESTCYCFDKKPSRVNRREQFERPCYNNQSEACRGDSRGTSKLTVYQWDSGINEAPSPADPPNGWQYSGCHPLEGFYLMSILDGNSTGYTPGEDNVQNENDAWNPSDASPSAKRTITGYTQCLLEIPATAPGDYPVAKL